MRKIFGITLGGLQQKIYNLVLIALLLLVGVLAAFSIYQSKQLSEVVNETNVEQQDTISQLSENTMNQVIDSAMVKTNLLQAYIADDMFNDLKTDVATLSNIASELFAHKDLLAKRQPSLPDPANEGKYTAQVLYEEGVDYTSSEYLGIASYMSETMVAMCSTSEYMNNCFIGLSDGTLICVDNIPAAKYDSNGNLTPFPIRERPWYTGAVEAGELCFSGIEYDTYTDNVGIECSAPIYLDGQLIGVVGADLFLNAMADYVDQSSNASGFISVVNNEGQVIFAPENNGVFTVKTSDEASDLRKSDNKDLAEFITAALSGNTGIKLININGKDYFMTGSSISSVGWAVVSFVEKDITHRSTDIMMEEYDRINNKARSKYEDGLSQSLKSTIIAIVLLMFICTGAALILAGRIVRPVEKMTRRIADLSGTDLLFEMDDAYRTGDEIEVLAESFASLSQKTVNFIEQIKTITAEKERIGAELELATKIQADMLPNIFPAFPERPEFDIFASMTPAKEVGGDFYDFFLIDDDHLGMVMADVSGKGVPAALFMMMSKILVNNYALMGGSPARVLEQVNTQVCKNNDEEMFVTVWLGILDLTTGNVIAANAGHEYPMIRKANGEFEIYKDKHGFVIGGMEGMRYKDYEFTIEKGGALFLYTDGVPEATNSENELFGTDRMIEALNKDPNAAPKILLQNIKASVDEFVGDAPQFDDLTMLCVKLLM